MENEWIMLLGIIEFGGFLAPIAFILFHLLRQFLFIPVVVVCMAGGVLFGVVYGTIFSLFGLFLSSFLFYLIIDQLPKTYEKLSNIKRKWFGEYRNLTVGQVAILRLIPFVHYHLLNFCLMERDRSFQSYLKASLLTNIPLAFLYTMFGQFILTFTPIMIGIFIFSLAILFYLFREKMTIIKWCDFFAR